MQMQKKTTTKIDTELFYKLYNLKVFFPWLAVDSFMKTIYNLQLVNINIELSIQIIYKLVATPPQPYTL